MKRVIIIGSGLTGITVAKTLIANRIKPIILDVGNKLPPEFELKVRGLSKLLPKRWRPQDRVNVMQNYTLRGGKSGLKKLEFGSDYFYDSNSSINNLPSSHAMGGFSQGWGSSSLVADTCDMSKWPITRTELLKHYKAILSDVPYSAKDDGLSIDFPVVVNKNKTLKLSSSSSSILNQFEKKASFLRDQNAIFGQSRLLVDSSEDFNSSGCKYCGLCMSGCVYGSIYKASHDLKKLIDDGNVDYMPGMKVSKLEEVEDYVKVRVQLNDGSIEILEASKVFLAAGAVNSTKIIVASKNLYGQSINMLSTKNFVVPMFRFRRNRFEWPNVNTLPEIFLEFKYPKLSNHWIHVQINTTNELVLMKLGVIDSKTGKVNKFRKRLAEHLVVAAVNMHSDHSESFSMKFEINNGDTSVHVAMKDRNTDAKRSVRLASRKLFSIMKSIGIIAITPLKTSGMQSFHIGGSLPMTNKPQKETETDVLGRPFGMNNIHVVDSSVFPSIPGTTVGLLAMANARRIALESLAVDSNILTK